MKVKRKRCIGFSEDGACPCFCPRKAAGTSRWCAACEKRRHAHITKQIEGLVEKLGARK